MNQQDVTAELAKPIAVEQFTGSTPARLAYVGRDGDPRVVPVGFHWTGTQILVFTATKAAKVAALRENPRVALTIDADEFGSPALLVRGSAMVEVVDGVPDEYVSASFKLIKDEQQREGWLQGVHALYEQMVRITITPDWAKLIDFQTTLPKAVADLVAAYGDPR